MVQEHFDVVVVGSGFGSLFFVEGYLSKRPAAKILMLERGTFNSHAWQLEQSKNSPIPARFHVSHRRGGEGLEFHDRRRRRHQLLVRADTALSSERFPDAQQVRSGAGLAARLRRAGAVLRRRRNQDVGRGLAGDGRDPAALGTVSSAAAQTDRGRRDHAQGSAAVSCSDRHGTRQCRRCRPPALLCFGTMQSVPDECEVHLREWLHESARASQCRDPHRVRGDALRSRRRHGQRRCL